MATNRFDSGRQDEPVFVDLDDDSDNSDWTILDDMETLGYVPNNPIGLTKPEMSASLQNVPSYHHRGLNLKIGDTVELDDGDFLLVKHISRLHMTGETFLEGHLFRRTYKLEGLLEKKKNEVVWIQQYNPNQQGDIYRQSLRNVELRKVIAKRDMILTNHTFPIGSYREEVASVRLGKEAILRTCRLACRWKYLAKSEKAGSIIALHQAQTDPSYQIDSSKKRITWRGSCVTGGSCADWLPGEKIFDRTERRRCGDLDPLALRQISDPLERPGQRYTFGDSFCGAGGVSRGAKAAGLRVSWGFDFNKAAIDSYRLNFHETMCWCCPADTFITAIPDDVKVDVLHLSFPCQPFSPAHVHVGQHDESNEAAFFALEGVLEKVRPRVVMVEETFGLLRTVNRRPWFRAMVQVFTKTAYSVRWKILNLLEYGLSGRRQRLFLFASW